MTDMTAYASEELHLSSVKGVSVHAGMLKAARNIHRQLVGNAHFAADLFEFAMINDHKSR